MSITLVLLKKSLCWSCGRNSENFDLWVICSWSCDLFQLLLSSRGVLLFLVNMCWDRPYDCRSSELILCSQMSLRRVWVGMDAGVQTYSIPLWLLWRFPGLLVLVGFSNVWSNRRVVHLVTALESWCSYVRILSELLWSKWSEWCSHGSWSSEIELLLFVSFESLDCSCYVSL